MKQTLAILLLLLSITPFAQAERGTITIRKINYDTIAYRETFSDSVSPYVFQARTYTKVNNPRYAGFLNDFVWIKGNYLYVFNKPISKNDQKNSVGTKTKSRFWRKIKRLKRKNKIHYFKIPFQDKWIDSVNTEYENDYTLLDVYHEEIKIAEQVKKIIIPDTEKITQYTKVFVRYIILNDTFMIFTANTSTNQTNSLAILSDLSSELIQTEQTAVFTLHLSCSKSINYNNYELIFDLKKSGANTVSIIKNKTEEYTCNYTIDGKYIYIENPPTPEFAKGKIDSKISSIKFKVHSTNHIYSMPTI